MIGYLIPSRCETLVLTQFLFIGLPIFVSCVVFASMNGSGPDFQDDFQFDRRTERKAGHTKYQSRRNSPFAEDISQQLRRRIGDLWMLGEFRRRGNVHAESHD